MLASITPLGERGRRARWGPTAAIFVASAALGAAAFGALAGLAGRALIAGAAERWRLALVLAALGGGAIWEVVRGRVPGPRRQVNERWLESYRRWVYASGFGAQLGTGVFTIVVSSAVYVVYVTAFAAASPGIGAAVGAAAGAMRGATLLFGWRVTTPARLVSLHARMAALGEPVHRAALTVQLLAAAVLSVRVVS